MTKIQVKNVFEGIHCYPNAPEEVAFLRNPHRHRFVVRTTIEVFGDDRELEFILVQRAIEKYVLTELGVDGTIDLQQHSCEWFAKFIRDFVWRRYGDNRDVMISVFEDDENGAIVEEFI